MATTRAVSVRRFHALLQQAVEPIFVLDADHKIVFVNRAWEALTGRSLDEVVGLACLPGEPDPTGSLDGLGDEFRPPPEALDGQPVGGPSLIAHAGGGRHWRRLEFWPLRNGRGDRVGLLGLARGPHDPSRLPESATQRLRAELREVQQFLWERRGRENLIGRGPSHRRLLARIATAAATAAPVLILGEPGTGKRLVALAIHQGGPNPRAPWLQIDVEALPAEILDREIFEVETVGEGIRLRAPQDATVLLEDILALPRDLQARLVSALETPGARVLATSHDDPETALGDGRLREDLYYAMTSQVIRLAPLRDRLDEIPLLAQRILERTNLHQERRRFGFTVEALDILRAHDWPGNIRELTRVVQAAQSRATGDLITADDLPAAIRGQLADSYPPPPPPPPEPLDQVLERVERRLIEQALQRARQNKSRAADLLAISRPRLYRRIKDLGIPDVPESHDEAPSAGNQHG